MPQGTPSVKQLMINKANATVVVVTSVACFVVVFCLVASATLIGQLSYQNRVISKKKVALKQLKTDIQSVQSLETSYRAFSTTPQNILNGNPQGNGPQDGDNAKVVLDALPSKYDFPALATSLEKILSSQNVQIQSIEGTDDEVAQASAGASSSPQPVEIPFQVTVAGSYDSIKGVVNAFEHSIRPIKVDSMTISASSQNSLTLNVQAKTYYQPEKSLNIKKEVVK